MARITRRRVSSVGAGVVAAQTGGPRCILAPDATGLLAGTNISLAALGGFSCRLRRALKGPDHAGMPGSDRHHSRLNFQRQ